jgi:adenylate kinase family enzyme
MSQSLAGAQRILVIGSSGAGKSTLARRLGAALALPVIHLDAVYFAPGWVEPDAGVWNARVAELIARERWVMDGCGTTTLRERLRRADAVVWLDFPTGVCIRRALARLGRTFGKVRPDMAPGCPEKFDLEFLGYLLTFRARLRPAIVSALAGYEGCWSPRAAPPT